MPSSCYSIYIFDAYSCTLWQRWEGVGMGSGGGRPPKAWHLLCVCHHSHFLCHKPMQLFKCSLSWLLAMLIGCLGVCSKYVEVLEENTTNHYQCLQVRIVPSCGKKTKQFQVYQFRLSKLKCDDCRTNEFANSHAQGLFVVYFGAANKRL